MKLTWFGGTTLRAYLGGEIVVIDQDGAPAGIDRGELLAGADRVVTLCDPAVPMIDPATWRQKPLRPLDEPPPPDVLRIGPTALLIAAVGEAPLIILGAGALPRFGRWADGAVILLTSGQDAAELLAIARPRLIALAMDEPALDRAIPALSAHLDGAGLVSLEPGLALEV